MKNIKITSALTLGFLLLGCDSRIDAVNQEMANIRNQPPLPIEPAPDFMPVETSTMQHIRSKVLFYQVLWLLN